MVFVQSRKDTVRTAQVLRDMAAKKNQSALFLTKDDIRYATAANEMNKSRNRELRVRTSPGAWTEKPPSQCADQGPAVERRRTIGTVCGGLGLPQRRHAALGSQPGRAGALLARACSRRRRRRAALR